MKPDEAEVLELAPRTAALVGLARSSLGRMSLQQRSQGLIRVNARLARRSALRFTPLRAVALALSLAIALVAGRLWLPLPGGAALAFTVNGQPGAPDAVVAATAERSSQIHFSDGTDVELARGSWAHVGTVTDHGARVALERGELHARVVHWEGSRWLFDAGPFQVTVRGTAFWVAWSPEDDQFDLKLEDGSVAVSAPGAAEPIALRAGQRLTMRLYPREILIRELPHDAGARVTAPAIPPADAPTAAPMAAAQETATAAHAAAAPPDPPRNWAVKLATGKAAAIVAEAEAWGIDACLAEATSSELSTLADAARYTRSSGLAKKALLAQRRRFAGSSRAADAAYMLGRLAEAGEGRAAALDWFDRYLAEAPGGAFASEAFGRKMLLVQQISGDERAAVVAREYLARFPAGTYASAARALLRAP